MSSRRTEMKGEIKRAKGGFVELTTFGTPKRHPSTPTRPVSTPILTSISASDTERRRDFVPKKVVEEKISYTEAKKKLKTALHELYRTLSLIQSYAGPQPNRVPQA